MADHILALDQGTTSTRAIIFDRDGRIVATAQREHRQSFPQPGWVEHDATEIWRNARNCIGLVLADAQLTPADIAAVGITNQRETTVCWDRKTGRPLHPAIVWQDTRTQGIVDRIAEHGGVDQFRERTGLPLNAYFTATKIAWLLENVEGLRERANAGEVLFGTVDTWLTWQLTGGPKGGVHVTDVTNASRSLLMRLDSCEWDAELLAAFGIPRASLPEIRSSSEVYGHCAEWTPIAGVPVAGILGDQQAATFGQAAFDEGEAKNTYGTGSFLVYGTGTEPVLSSHGLLTTVAYKLGDGATHYALEGSIAVTGSLVQWLRDNLGLISTSAEIEPLAASVDDNGGCYIVPAFSGLYAPWWRPDARGVIVGLTRYITKGHIARAALESTAFQSADVLEACNADADEPLTELRVDGGMTVNDALMQFQADVLGVPVVRPVITETTALGAAFAAGLAVGFWADLDALRALWREDRRFEPAMSPDERARLRREWRKAVSRSFDLA
ncbi:glycerol kinase GlpK [Gulosibacter molinativorax]|uniref:Glycerol kinase n=1 Tax=Gulosibacter molinativorax TaxID=256821 RepID=A0ABT7C472_9MICO|nr:glycerol kinase GlpK [Gulosibacter molinativorax]MDJ1370016.1 glycerol kinase [Gulosibacter molinativorax]QUY63794.1 Glycerol kinase [Gulosibacter molinativorax]